MLLLLWVVTPIQSAIIVTDIPNISYIVESTHYLELVPFSDYHIQSYQSD